MKLLLFAVFALGSMLSLTSCNTLIGIGRDFQQVGRGFENKGNGRKWNPNAHPNAATRQFPQQQLPVTPVQPL